MVIKTSLSGKFDSKNFCVWYLPVAFCNFYNCSAQRNGSFCNHQNNELQWVVCQTETTSKYFYTIDFFEFFTVCTKLAEMAILYPKDLRTTKKKLPSVGLDPMLQIITGVGVQCLTKWAKQAFACKSKTFRSLYSHALLIIAKSSQFL